MGHAVSQHGLQQAQLDEAYLAWQPVGNRAHSSSALGVSASAFLDRKMVKPLDWVWYPGKDAENTQSSQDISGALAKHKKGGDADVDHNAVQDLEEYDKEMRTRAKDLMLDHGFPSNEPGTEGTKVGNEVWRCVPMDQIDLAGPEAAKQSGAALYSMKAKPDGHIAMEVPKRPPIYNPLGREEAPKLDIKGLSQSYRQVLRDPNGKWYWVMTANGEPARSQRDKLKIEQGPIEPEAPGTKPTGVTMMCHSGKQSFDVPAVAPGLFELQKRATTFLEVDRPVQLRRASDIR